MSAPISDDENSDYSRFAPKRLREQLPMPAARHLYPAPTVPSSRDVDQDGRTMSELAPWPEQVRGHRRATSLGPETDRPDCR
jgi:hypothetical protein